MKIKYFLVVIANLMLLLNNGHTQTKNVEEYPFLKKIKDIVIYKDTIFYSSFPSVVKTKDNKIMVAFRRAPERRMFGESHTHHVDANSYLVQITSNDGENWTENPELIYAHHFGGSQDPCLLTLRDGTIICASYGWAFLREEGMKNMPNPNFQTSGATSLGGYLVTSKDDGRTWQGPIYPPSIEQEKNFNAHRKKRPVHNRGAMVEGRDGRIYWVVAVMDESKENKTSNHLMVSDDRGETWSYKTVVAEDAKIAFNEASIYETPKGDLVAFLRTAGYDDQACIARSTDGGETFEWQSMGFQGHPLQALKLPDDRVLVTYGYRHKPFGIRARILNAECTDFDTAEEFVIRTDGGSGDIGYPWAVMLENNRILVTYYFNKNNGTRYIAGSILELSHK